MAITSSEALDRTWRGSLGRHILYGTSTPTWTTEDQRVFLIYAARFEWKMNLAPGDAGTKDLQKELLVYTSHRALNGAILLSLVTAVKARLADVRRRVPNVLEWPPWTRRWFLNPLWDGDTTEPPAAGMASGSGLLVDCFPGADDAGRQTIDPLAVWDPMTDDTKHMCFAAAREAARRTQGPTSQLLLLGQQPIRRMVYRFGA